MTTAWHRSRVRPRTSAFIVSGVVLLLLGGVLTPIAVFRSIEVAEITANGVSVVGEIVAVETRQRGRACCRRDYSVATVRFETRDGAPHLTILEKRLSPGQEPYRVSEPLALVYHRSDPTRTIHADPHELDDARFVVVVAVSVLAAGAVLLVVGIVVTRRRQGGRPHPGPAG